MDYESSSREGAFLEKTVASLFSRSGFTVKLNHIELINGVKHEVDVLVLTPQGEKIIVECKQRRDETTEILKTYLDALIGKKTCLKADKALLVTNASVKEHYVAYEANGVYFWDGEELFQLQSLPEKELATEIYKKMGLRIMEENAAPTKRGISGIIALLKTHWKVALIGIFVLFLLIIIFWDTIVKVITLVVGLIIVGIFIGIAQVLNKNTPQSSRSTRKRREKPGKVKKIVYFK